MRIININLNENIINLVNIVNLTSGTYKNDMCHFCFSKEWNDLKDKYAVFVTKDKAYKKAIIDNECEIPLEICSKAINFSIGIYGQILENAEIKRRESSKLLSMQYEEGAYKENLDETEALAEASLYETYISRMNNIYTNVNIRYEEAIEDINEKEIDVKRNIEEYTVHKIQEFNLNVDNKKEEINQIADDVSTNKQEIENMKTSIETSEQNAKTSETNAKTSEQNAQNSAKNALESESNVISIENNIIQMQNDVQANREATDTNVVTTNNNVTEATRQAGISTAQAQISTDNATQTNADKTAVETMRNEVSSMKTSVEQIKNDTQGIYNNTVDVKNETLQAKTEVENSLENERIEIDKRYAKSINSDIITINEVGKVELDEDGYMEDVEIESNLEITQETREGYNYFNKDGVTVNTSVETISYVDDILTAQKLNSYNWIIFTFPNTTLPAGTYYFSFKIKLVSGTCEYIHKISFNHNISGVEETTLTKVLDTISSTYQTIKAKIELSEALDVQNAFFQLPYDASDVVIEITDVMIANEDLEYEQYGVSPSPEYPSPINIANEFKIDITGNDASSTTILILPNGMELCKIGEYKDYIFKRNGKYYYYKEIDKMLLDGNSIISNFVVHETTYITANFNDSKIKRLAASNVVTNISDKLVGATGAQTWEGQKLYSVSQQSNGNYIQICLPSSIASTDTELAEWLNSNNILVYYVLAAPTEEEITDTEFIAQLESIKLFCDLNNIEIDRGKFEFVYNKSLAKILEEKDTKIDNLQAQIDELRQLLTGGE